MFKKCFSLFLFTMMICLLLFSCGNTGSDDSSVPEQSAEENSGYVEVSAEESAAPSEEPSIPEQSAEESSKETATIPILTADDVHFEEGSNINFSISFC